MAESTVDPGRAAVERVDAVVRDFQEPVIDDPTVFVKGAALGALTIGELARLAQSKSRDSAIRAFADRSRKNQQALRAELGAVAGRQRLDVPATLVYSDEQMLQQATGKSGAQFDTWYAQTMAQEQLKALTLFEAAANMKNAQLAAFAKKWVATLESDRKSATDLATR